MVRDRLHVWHDDKLIGCFSKTSSGAVTFEYIGDMPSLVSLSLPRSGEWKPEAPYRYLDGLLPDDVNERWRMKDALGTESIDPFDLLDAVDTAGGYSYTKDDVPPKFRTESLIILSPADLEAEIANISAKRFHPWIEEGETRGRFSLAGTQGKFTLARYENVWVMPSASVPSTHIVKPDIRNLPSSSMVEDASMTLAASCGLEVPTHGILQAKSAQAFIVQRFDRRMANSGLAVRLHTEDLTQALGISKDEKYDIEIADVVSALHAADPTDDLAYRWMEQVAFNVHAGNCDAHGKNYSLILEGGNVTLSPMYDVVDTLVWSQFQDSLAMTVNGKWFAREIGLDDWKYEAENCGLDPEKVAASAEIISGQVQSNAPEAASGLPENLRTAFIESIATANERMDPPERESAKDIFDRAAALSQELDNSEMRNAQIDVERN